MKKIVKRNQLVVTGLAVMIAVAGYLNYSQNLKEEVGEETTQEEKQVADAAQDTTYEISEEDIFTDTEENVQTTAQAQEDTAQEADETDGSEKQNAGEVVLTGSTGAVASADYMAQLKLNREQARSQNKASLEEMIKNEALTKEQRQQAVDRLVSLTDLSEREAACEMLLSAKGYQDAVVSITDNTADVVVNLEKVEDAQRAQIEDIVLSKAGENIEDIVISPVSQDSAQ